MTCADVGDQIANATIGKELGKESWPIGLDRDAGRFRQCGDLLCLVRVSSYVRLGEGLGFGYGDRQVVVMQNEGCVGTGEFRDGSHFADEGLVALKGAVGFGGGRTFRIDVSVRSFARSARSHGL